MTTPQRARTGLRGSRRLRAVATGAALLAGTTTLTAGALTAPAQAAPPGFDQCPAAFPIDEVAKGDTVSGLTVTEGTDPTGFSGEVLGILPDAVAPGVDLIMVQLSMPEFDRTHGIWFGMSGSPVYSDSDGRLLGAVAYGGSWAPSDVIGLTPASQMNKLLDADAAARVTLTDSQARTLARQTDVSTRQASQGFTQLQVPIGVSGISQRHLNKAMRKFDYPTRNVFAAPSAGRRATDPGPAMVAGGNLASAISYGDITAAGVGTVTEVCDDQVLGFGHPMLFSGPTSMSLHNADALFIQPDDLGGPYKVAVPYGPSGTITDDRRAGIHGFIGPIPGTAQVTSDTRSVEHPANDRLGAVTEINLSDWVPDLGATHVLANNEAVFDAYAKGSSFNAWTIRGTRQDGSPFHLNWEDHYADTYDITFPSALQMYVQLSELVYSTDEDITITDVDVDSTLSERFRQWSLDSAQIRQHGEWKKLTRRSDYRLVQGQRVRLRANLISAMGDERTVQRAITVPRNAGRYGALSISGGGSGGFFYYRATRTFDEVLQRLRQADHNDEITFSFESYGRRGKGPSDETSARLGAAIKGRVYSSVRVLKAAG